MLPGGSVFIYAITSLLFAVPIPIMWYARNFKTLWLVILLFAVDSVLTIEAAYYSDIVAIAILHVVTVPALFGLIFVDLLKQSRTDFKCFLCGAEIPLGGSTQLTRRLEDGNEVKVEVHSTCVSTQDVDRNPISERVFRKGIPA